MKYFFRSSAFKIILGTVLIISGVILYTSVNPNGNVFSNTISLASSPLQKAMWHVSTSAFDFAYQIEEKEKLKEENESLKKQISELRDTTVDYYNLKHENARFAKYYEFKKSDNSLEFVSASVMGKDPAEIFGDFIIDKGSKSGISLGDTVITENGLVGRVCQVNFNSSRVKTILSPDSKIGVINTRTCDSGVISGETKLSSENLTRMAFIPAQSGMQKGDIIVTSGISGMYPKNLKVGQIKSIEYDNYDSSYYAVMEPFEKIKNIRDVFVITDFQGKGEVKALENPAKP